MIRLVLPREFADVVGIMKQIITLVALVALTAVFAGCKKETSAPGATTVPVPAQELGQVTNAVTK